MSRWGWHRRQALGVLFFDARAPGSLLVFCTLCVLGKALWLLREFHLCGCDLGPWLAPKSFQVVWLVSQMPSRSWPALLIFSTCGQCPLSPSPGGTSLIRRLSHTWGSLGIWSGVHSSCTNWGAGSQGCPTFPIQSRLSFRELSCHSKASMQGVCACTSACWGRWHV